MLNFKWRKITFIPALFHSHQSFSARIWGCFWVFSWFDQSTMEWRTKVFPFPLHGPSLLHPNNLRVQILLCRLFHCQRWTWDRCQEICCNNLISSENHHHNVLEQMKNSSPHYNCKDFRIESVDQHQNRTNNACSRDDILRQLQSIFYCAFVEFGNFHPPKVSLI